MTYASSEVLLDVVLEIDTAVCVVGTAPVDQIDVASGLEQPPHQRAIGLQVEYPRTVDQRKADEERPRRLRRCRSRPPPGQVTVERGLTAAPHRALGRAANRDRARLPEPRERRIDPC